MIYAAIAPDIAEVKFGISADPQRRVEQLASLRGTRVILAAKIPGSSRHEERRWLKKSRGYRMDGEWFHECPEVMAVVSEMMFMEQAARS